ncbi:MAG: metallophosphoesterase family protein [Ferruginibacter sp.]
MALQNGIVIRWRTDIATDSKVSYGLVAGSLNQSATDNVLATEHIVTLTGLTANTLYYYSIGSTSGTLQGDGANYFKTMPPVGSSQKTRFVAMGDMGTNVATQLKVRDAWLSFNGTNYTDGWLLLGDNAYNSGTDAEYQTNFFNIYQSSLTKNHVLWPAPGNHDYANSPARQADHAIPYYSIFSLPKNGEAGGVPSNTEAFYSYNYANIHFVALDSYGWETGSTRLYDTLGPQVAWLKQDLAANTQQWTVVYFHHPPYTKGSHNSDTETELVNLRQRLVPILERYKVDLVLNGHSHSYERSYPINGHYGLENTFNAGAHALSTSSGKYDGSANSCAYIKNAAEIRNGIVYALAGSSGQVTGTTAGYPHDAMYYSNTSIGGAFYFEVDSNRLDAKWICADSVIRDNFTIFKGVNKRTDTTIMAGDSIHLSASWVGNYMWTSGATTRSINVGPNEDTTYNVWDNNNCLADTFNVTVLTPIISLCPPSASISLSATATGSSYQWQLNTGSGFTNITDNANYSGTNTATLQLINLPSAWYGYKYRIVISGYYINKTFQIKFSNTWTGTAGSAWEDVANWSCGVLPDANTDVIINSGNVIVNSNATCRSITVKSGANFTISPGFVLDITH